MKNMRAGLVGALLFAPLAPAGQVLVVDDDGPADFADIQNAVDVSLTDTTILVRPGTYQGFSVDDKSISIAGSDPEQPRITGQVRVFYLSAERTVSLSNLYFEDGFSFILNEGSILVNRCHGERPGLATAACTNPPDEVHHAHYSDKVIISDSTLIGRDGDSISFGSGGYDGAHGENALDVLASRVAVYRSTLDGGDGGHAVWGQGLSWIRPWVGYGGDGISATQASEVYVDECVLFPGLGGTGEPGPPGVPIYLNASSATTALDPHMGAPIPATATNKPFHSRRRPSPWRRATRPTRWILRSARASRASSPPGPRSTSPSPAVPERRHGCSWGANRTGAPWSEHRDPAPGEHGPRARCPGDHPRFRGTRRQRPFVRAEHSVRAASPAPGLRSRLLPPAGAGERGHRDPGGPGRGLRSLSPR